MAWMLLVESVVMCTGPGFISYYQHMYRFGDAGNFNRWFNSLDASFLGIAVGSVSMLVFGFIDNAGLFFGSAYLDEFFEHLPASDDANVFAG